MKPGIPQGTRDFSAETIRKRLFIFTTIKTVFELYGFEPLETPSMENLETLSGKYGDEGDKLIFKILNNGLENPKKQQQVLEDFEKILQGRNAKSITERALRYDLTIPFARYVAMNYSQLTFPFKRYQMQPVWRADRPQKGRYREFYQCDADVVGSNSLINDVELSEIYLEVFKRIGIDVQIKINNRKILKGIMEVCGVEDKEKQILVIIDKTDKIGVSGVKEELSKEEIESEKLKMLLQFYTLEGSNHEKIKDLKELLKTSRQGLNGIDEIEFVLNYLQSQISNLKSQIYIDLTLARGLEYYTGIIYEAKAPDVRIGSIGGGGRYDDLTGLFGVPGIPGVGISFGVDRIYDVMEELDLFPKNVHSGTTALFFNMGDVESKFAFKYVQLLRKNNISCELFHEPAKIDKQFKYASKKNILYAIIIGSKEMTEQTCVVKNLTKGEQKIIELSELGCLNWDL